jgi:hypothetical protein
MDLQRSLGLNDDGSAVVGTRDELIRYINLKLAALGAPVAGDRRARGSSPSPMTCWLISANSAGCWMGTSAPPIGAFRISSTTTSPM